MSIICPLTSILDILTHNQLSNSAIKAINNSPKMDCLNAYIVELQFGASQCCSSSYMYFFLTSTIKNYPFTANSTSNLMLSSLSSQT